MKVFTYNPTAACISLSRVGKVRGLTVEFSRGNDVTFRRQGAGYELTRINQDYSFNLFMFTSSVDELSHEENVMLVAAMLCLNMNEVKVGSELITLGAPNGVIHTIIIDSPAPQPVRHASGWDKAKEFGVSGHRKAEAPRHTRTTVEPIQLSKTKKGWLALGAVAALTVGAIVLAAAVTED